MAQDFIDIKEGSDIKAIIAEKERELKLAKENATEQNEKVKTLTKTLHVLKQKSGTKDRDWKDLVGKWWNHGNFGGNAQLYTYVIEDMGFRVFNNGTTYRQLKCFDLSISAWDEDEDPDNSIWLHGERLSLCEPEDLKSFKAVSDEDIKKYIIHFFTKIFDRLESRNMLPDMYKEFTSSKKGVLCEPDKIHSKQTKKQR